MKKTILLWIIGIMIVSTIASASTEILHTAVVINNTWRNQAYVQYFADDENMVDSEKMNFYIKYSCENSVENWNANHISNMISNITLKSIYTERLQNESGGADVFTQSNKTINVNGINAPFYNYYEFFSLASGETQLIVLDTNYITNSVLKRYSPCGFDVYFATAGCSRCSEYNFKKLEQSINQTDVMQSHIDTIQSRIKTFFGYQYAFILIAYYVFLIAMFISIVLLLFYALIWVYHWIQDFKRK